MKRFTGFRKRRVPFSQGDGLLVLLEGEGPLYLTLEKGRDLFI